MEIRVGFVQPDGTTLRPKEREITSHQYAFMILSHCVGLPRLDRSTLDEFVRRVDLYQTYVGPVLHSSADGSPILLDRTYLMSLLPGGAWTNVTMVDGSDFDATMARYRNSYWNHVDSTA